MRRIFHHMRSMRSIVQQTCVQNTRSLIRNIANGQTVDLNVDQASYSFDYDLGEEVDFDKKLLSDAPSKIAQFLHPELYLSPEAGAVAQGPGTPPSEPTSPVVPEESAQ